MMRPLAIRMRVNWRVQHLIRQTVPHVAKQAISKRVMGQKPVRLFHHDDVRQQQPNHALHLVSLVESGLSPVSGGRGGSRYSNWGA